MKKNIIPILMMVIPAITLIIYMVMVGIFTDIYQWVCHEWKCLLTLGLVCSFVIGLFIVVDDGYYDDGDYPGL